MPTAELLAFRSTDPVTAAVLEKILQLLDQPVASTARSLRVDKLPMASIRLSAAQRCELWLALPRRRSHALRTAVFLQLCFELARARVMVKPSLSDLPSFNRSPGPR
jgi:hypothetical protein